MRTGTKFWLAVGTVASMVLLCGLYILKSDKVDATVLGVFIGVITLVVGGYFTSNVVASGQKPEAPQ
jgi:glucose uptake protein GlcU